jgi:putative transposase
MDWASRAVLAWRLSNTMDSSFCVAAPQEALARFGTPDTFNTDQGQPVHQRAGGRAGGRISMDGCGRCMDNVFIERMWRSFKHEDKATRTAARRTAASLRGLRFTIPGAHIRRSASARQWRCGAKAASVD